MSLINQMLKDLEARRAQELELPDTPLQGVSRYRVIPLSSSWLTRASIIVILVLLLSLAWLVWDRYQIRSYPLATQSATTKVTPPQAAPVGKQVIGPAKPGVREKANPTPLPDKQPALARAETPQPGKRQAVKAPAQVVEPDAADDVRPASSNPVQKRVRQLTAEQRAEKSYQAAYRLFAQGQVKSGETELLKALQHEPRHTRSRELLAGTYIKTGRYVEAGSLLKQGLALDPQHWMFARLYARVLLQQNQVDAAVGVLSRQLPGIKQQPQHYALLAALYQKQANYQAAANTYTALVRQFPQQGVWWIGLGVSKEKLGDVKAASTAFEKALQTGTLPKRLRTYSDNRINAIKESGYPLE